MKKIKTLKKNYEFKNVLNNGKFYIKNQLIVYIKKNKKNENYIGIAINTKICNAVKRNRVKRIIRENYRIIEPDLKKGYDIVFLWNKNYNPNNISFKIIKKEMMEIFQQAEILIK